MSSPLESPVPALVLGILAELVLGWLLVTTGRKGFLWGMAGVLGALGIALVVERLVVTEAEKVEAVLDAAVAALERNDLPGVERCLSHRADGLRGRLRAYAGEVVFSEVRIRNVEVRGIYDLESPPGAVVHLQGTALFDDRSGMFPYHAYSSGFEVELIREPDGWKIDEVRGDPQNPVSPEASP